jgi:hypothetical protein
LQVEGLIGRLRNTAERGVDLMVNFAKPPACSLSDRPRSIPILSDGALTTWRDLQ